MTTQKWVGSAVLALVAVAAIWWLSIDPQRTQAWAVLTAVVATAGQMVQ